MSVEDLAGTGPVGDRFAAALDRSQLLLSASVALSRTSTVPDVVAAVRHLVVGVLDPAHVGVSLVGRDGRLSASPGGTPHLDEVGLVTLRTGAPVLLADLGAVTATAPAALASFQEMGWQSAAAVPLPGPAGPVGVLVFVWKVANTLDEADQAVLAALAGYVAQALRRAWALDDRRTAAAILQKALLTHLPDDVAVRLAARYVPAHHEDHVGGDWYDVIRLDSDRMALVIGDVTGHDLDAAAAMSEYRSMLRTLIIDRRESPSAVLRRLEQTGRALGNVRFASALLAYLTVDPAGGHELTWSNAGHPVPLLRLPDGTVATLDDGGADPLLGAVRHQVRHNRTRHLPPGSLLLLYTDGLVESRTATLDEGFARLHDAFGPAGDVEEIADRLIEGADREDDAALLLVGA